VCSRGGERGADARRPRDGFRQKALAHIYICVCVCVSLYLSILTWRGRSPTSRWISTLLSSSRLCGVPSMPTGIYVCIVVCVECRGCPQLGLYKMLFSCKAFVHESILFCATIPICWALHPLPLSPTLLRNIVFTPDPPLLQYTIQYWSWQYRVTANPQRTQPALRTRGHSRSRPPG